MGAALHLAHVHQAPPGPKRKRGGGGGSGDGYDAFVARIWKDPRQTAESRELLLLIAWLRHRDPARHDEDQTTWGRASAILGTDGHTRGLERPRVAVLINSDRPRYEPDRSAPEWDQLCDAPMIRRAGTCGANATERANKVDPATGWLTPIWYCSRHRDFGRATEAAFRAQERPHPTPNRGGLLPSYLTARDGDAGWGRLYEWASKWCYSSWNPPQGYGLTADEWPLPGVEPPVAPPRLRLAAVDGELLGGVG